MRSQSTHYDKTAFLKPLADGFRARPAVGPNGREGGGAEQALAQIKAKGYHEKYLRRGKKVTLVGAAFDAGMRNLSDRVIEVVDQGQVRGEGQRKSN